jgi:adenylate cyclase
VVSFSKDADTVSRSEHLIFNYQGHCFPTHALAPVLRRVGSTAVRISGNTAYIQSTGKPDIAVPLNRDGEYYANMYGRYNTYSYSGVIQSMMKLQQGITEDLMVRPEEFAGKIIYVGTSAAATQDQKNTSIGNDVPGVFLHASICGNILDHDVLNFVPFYARCLIMAGLIGSCVFLVLFLKSNTLKINIPIAAALSYGVLSVILFSKNMVIPVALPLTVMVIAYFASFMIITFTEGKEKRKVKNILGQYVSPAMLSMVLANSKEEYLKAEVGTKENLTIFFSDIRGFTSISERYPVEKVVEALNAYLSMMVDIIFDNSGTLDKFIGDAIMAFWGAPVRFDDHPYKAVLSAIRMVQAMNRLNIENMDKDLPELKIGIGIHTDLVILGNIGSRKKLDYTVIGDGVNLTSRLEGLTKTYASEILISQSTYDHVKERVCCRIADFVKVKGKDEPLVIYQVRGLELEVSPWDRTLAEKTREGFDLYRSGYFKAAKAIYDEILQTEPDDGLARLFSDRCDELIRTVPSDGWDGCYVHKSK